MPVPFSHHGSHGRVNIRLGVVASRQPATYNLIAERKTWVVLHAHDLKNGFAYSDVRRCFTCNIFTRAFFNIFCI